MKEKVKIHDCDPSDFSYGNVHSTSLLQRPVSGSFDFFSLL